MDYIRCADTADSHLFSCFHFFVFQFSLPLFEDVVECLKASRTANVKIFPLHSSLSSHEQNQVFQPVPAGWRKIVVSTNIAETSVTIEDVVYVIDTCRVKENSYDEVQYPVSFL